MSSPTNDESSSKSDVRHGTDGTVPSSAVNPSTPNPEPAPMWLRRADQVFMGVLLITLLALLVAFRWKLSNGFRTEIEITSQQPREYYYALDINQASWVEWSQLDGIGEKLAKRIVEDRRQRGPFQSIEDVQRVKGVGPKMMDKLRPFLRLGSIPIQESSELSQRPE